MQRTTQQTTLLPVVLTGTMGYCLLSGDQTPPPHGVLLCWDLIGECPPRRDKPSDPLQKQGPLKPSDSSETQASRRLSSPYPRSRAYARGPTQGSRKEITGPEVRIGSHLLGMSLSLHEQEFPFQKMTKKFYPQEATKTSIYTVKSSHLSLHATRS